jgi:hypothetical protein
VIDIEKGKTVGHLRELIKAENTKFANIDAKFLDLYLVDIVDVNKEVLKGHVLAQSLTFPLLSTTFLNNIFSNTHPRSNTIHFIVNPSKSHG